MFRLKNVSLAVLALCAASSATVAVAQTQQLERVEITGSAVRRIDGETSLPVQIIKRADIEKSGATSTVDLLQKLPAVQGSVTEAAGVGGSTFGFSGVSLHNLTENRTLVLLNGRRLAQFGGQTLTGFAAAVDLNTIPLAAIERVEILTDGASALYGSDAVAGVVNFITKRDSREGDITLGASMPKGGGEEARVSISKGFGSLEENGFNLLFAFNADKRKLLNSTDRSFARSGVVTFERNGQRYQFFNGSPRGIPGNTTDDAGDLVSPYYLQNGSCPAQHVPVETAAGKFACYYDYVTQLEIYPERERQSFMTSFTKSLGSDHKLFADVLVARAKTISRIAPVPGEVAVNAGTPLHTQYLLPVGITGDSIMSYRAADLGKRTNKDTADFLNLTTGVEGLLAGWDYNLGYSHSESKVKGNIEGYPGALAFARLLASGLLNPFVGPGQQTPEAMQAIRGAAYNGYWDGGTSKLDNVQLRASREIFKLSGGSAAVATGVNFTREQFISKPSPFAQGILADPVTGAPCDPADPDTCDQRFGDASAKPPYSASRNSYGLFGELLLPVAKSVELTTSARYDHYSDFGGATTGKASFRWTPSQGVLVRGSVGTGFRAPTVPQVNGVLQSYGVTSEPYPCSPALAAIAASLGAICRPPGTQYDQFAAGNKNLKPEKSRQATLGLRFEPTQSVSLGADLWWVALRDAFGQLTEQAAFNNPAAYPNNWTVARDVGTGTNYVGLILDNQNLGKLYTSGIDLDLIGRANTEVGQITSQVTATYMLREKQQLQEGGVYYSAIGNNNPDLGTVTFRWQGKWVTSLTSGPWQHSLGVNFKAGYKDVETEVETIDAAGNITGTEVVQLRAKEYFTFDWQTQWKMNKSFSITAGVLNILNEDPPLSLATGGLNKGQMIGYDDRYYDPRGRTFYLNASYKF